MKSWARVVRENQENRGCQLAYAAIEAALR